MNEIKTSVAQEATKLETAIEAKLVDSVEKEEVFSCVRELREEVVGIGNKANNGMTEVTTDPRYHRPPDGSRWYGGSVVRILTNYCVTAVSDTASRLEQKAEVGGVDFFVALFVS